MRQTGGKGQFGHVVHRPRAHGPRRRVRVHQQDRRRQDPAGVHPRGGPGHPGGPRERRPGRLPHGGRPRHARSTAPTTRWTPREMAFKIAGSMACKDAARKADPVLLEPVMEFEVTTPEEFMGDVMGDVTARRGRIENIDERSGQKVDPGRACRWRSCSATPRTCAHDPGPCRAQPHAAPRVQRGARRRSPRRSSPGSRASKQGREGAKMGSRSSSGRSPTSTSARWATSTTARPR